MSSSLVINVAQLLKEDIGATRQCDVDESIAPLSENAELTEPVHGTVRLMRTNRGVLVRANLETSAKLECGRCLEAFVQHLPIRFSEEFIPKIDVTNRSAGKCPARKLRVHDRRAPRSRSGAGRCGNTASSSCRWRRSARRTARGCARFVVLIATPRSELRGSGRRRAPRCAGSILRRRWRQQRVIFSLPNQEGAFRATSTKTSDVEGPPGRAAQSSPPGTGPKPSSAPSATSRGFLTPCARTAEPTGAGRFSRSNPRAQQTDRSGVVTPGQRRNGREAVHECQLTMAAR